MPSLLQRPLVPEMGREVLDLLRQLTPLPDRGIVAGQAITSALLRLYGDSTRQGPINDIDIFSENTAPARALKMNFDLKVHKVGLGNSSIRLLSSAGEYNVIPLPEMTSRKGLAITNVTTAGLLNFIHCNSPALGGGTKTGARLRSADVISSFDLNCVEAAVDLETGSLSWTRDFAWFIKTQQLQVTNVHGEVHTLVRVLKKTEEMPWIYCDMEATRRALMFTLGIKEALELTHAEGMAKTQKSFRGSEVLARAMRRQLDAQPPNTPYAAISAGQEGEFNGKAQWKSVKYLPLLGPIYMDRVKRFGQEVSLGFDISTTDSILRGSALKVATAKVKPHDEMFRDFGVLHALARATAGDAAAGYSQLERHGALLKSLPVVLSKTAGMSYRVGMVNGAAVARRAAALHRAVDHFIANVERQNALRIEAARQKSLEKGVPFVELNVRLAQVPKTDDALTLKSLQFQDAPYLVGQVDERSATALEAFVHKHPLLGPLLQSLPFEDQVTAMKNLLQMDREHDGVVIGLFETTHFTSAAINSRTLVDLSLLRERTAMLMEVLNRPLNIQPLLGSENTLTLSAGGTSVQVREILSPLGLRLEGVRMSHCVGGYANKVRDGLCRIFSLTSGKSAFDASTLEVSFTEKMGLVFPLLAQHRGFANNPVPSAHKDAAAALLVELGKKITGTLERRPWDHSPVVLKDLLITTATQPNRNGDRALYDAAITATLVPASGLHQEKALKDLTSQKFKFDSHEVNINEALGSSGSSRPSKPSGHEAFLLIKASLAQFSLESTLPVVIDEKGLVHIPKKSMRGVHSHVRDGYMLLRGKEAVGTLGIISSMDVLVDACLAQIDRQPAVKPSLLQKVQKAISRGRSYLGARP